MKFQFDAASAIQKAHEVAETAIETHIAAVGRTIVRELLREGKNGGVEGLAHEIIRRRVEEFVLSDAFARKVDTAIEQVAEPEIQNAVKILMASKSGKHLFSSEE